MQGERERAGNANANAGRETVPLHPTGMGEGDLARYLELVRLLDHHLQVSVLPQAGAAHLSHLLILQPHGRLVRIGVA